MYVHTMLPKWDCAAKLRCDIFSFRMLDFVTIIEFFGICV